MKGEDDFADAEQGKFYRPLEELEFCIQETGKYNFSWEGGLAELKKRYDSVELQHQATDWR